MGECVCVRGSVSVSESVSHLRIPCLEGTCSGFVADSGVDSAANLAHLLHVFFLKRRQHPCEETGCERPREV